MFLFDPEKSIWTIKAISSSGTAETFKARHVVSSVPIAELISALVEQNRNLAHLPMIYQPFVPIPVQG
jgi:hypothetical protein